ncbi:eIF-3 RNA-binding subunit [Gonapodya prolifera JEL478]|uniref:Eukaryotic translation initiation factor 3 subunit G n=1 Tax=Gonapodya prolifera (strain JEL478) TaxID=1344416 RepID=A0A139A5L3_GONPJ|nr:eIF-3 RNA-binding subunit [Gonapodya prolifera JEL478]|eukprot:KXS12066.1 eIF-3 RNA-binding subunit [Gonapodya prolifera JEL478]
MAPVVDANRKTWADEEEAPEGAGQDEIIEVVFTRKNEAGKTVKVTQKMKRTLVKTVTNHVVAERKKWTKFGDAKGDRPGPNQSTTVVGEKMDLKMGPIDVNVDNAENEGGDKKLNLTKAPLKCRICKGAHFTARCPYKDSMGADSESEMSTKKPEVAPPSEPEGAAGRPGKYVPPSLRGDRAAGSSGPAGESMMMRPRDEYPTLRVSNLTEDATEEDMSQLFKRFGRLQRCFVAKDRETGLCKGFAFISFYSHEDAQKAIDKVNGYGYDNLILKVEFAEPRKDKP